MTDIQVVRAYVDETVGWSNTNTTIQQDAALAALDSLEAELAQVREERDAALTAIREYVAAVEAPQGEHLYEGAWDRLAALTEETTDV